AILRQQLDYKIAKGSQKLQPHDLIYVASSLPLFWSGSKTFVFRFTEKKTFEQVECQNNCC
ncbi:hypothetical protein, partial [Enterococcus entomosocium]|uniref:hypothetical protein n=1 Tax=Enterococcus entomosocium TaxID=3034352 RepID=UPI002647CA9D